MTFDLHRLDNVELAKTGTWEAASGTFTITPEHFTAAVEAQHDPEIGRPRIKFGHRSALNDILAQLGDGAPAYGYIENLRTSPDGNTLYGDLAGIPDSVAGLIGRAYQQRSVEMRIEASTPSGRTYKAALTGLALLGATPPAVKGLADLMPLFASQAEADQHDVNGNQVTVTLSDDTPHDTETMNTTTPTATHTENVGTTSTRPATGTGTPDTKEKPAMATWTPTPEQLKLLGLDENATAEDISTALAAKLTAATEGEPGDGENTEDGKQTTPDGTETETEDAQTKETVNASQSGVKTVTLSEGVYEDMKNQLSVLMSEKVARDNAALLTDALNTGKIAAADKPHIEALLSESPEAGRKFLANLKPGRVNMSETGTSHAKTAAPETDQSRIDAEAEAILKGL